MRNLDLQLVRVRQIPDRDAEPARRDLLDRRPLRITVGERLESLGIFTPFAGIRLAANPVHRDRQRLVRLGRDRSEAHGAGAESFDDFARFLDFFDRNGSVGRRILKAKQPTQSAASPSVGVGVLGKAVVGVLIARAGGDLNILDRLRIPHVPFALGTPVEFAMIGKNRQTLLGPLGVAQLVSTESFLR